MVGGQDTSHSGADDGDVAGDGEVRCCAEFGVGMGLFEPVAGHWVGDGEEVLGLFPGVYLMVWIVDGGILCFVVTGVGLRACCDDLSKNHLFSETRDEMCGEGF